MEASFPLSWNRVRQQLLTREEEAIAVREKGVGVSERALVKVSQDLDAKWVKTKATHQEYLEKMCAHTARTKHTLSLDKILGRRKSYPLRRSRTSRWHWWRGRLMTSTLRTTRMSYRS
jgi:hypothetical protein